MIRMIRLIVMAAALLVPSLGIAGYQNPTVIANDPIAEGDSRIRLQFTGNAGEPTAQRTLIIPDGTTNQSIRNMVDDLINQLDRKRTAATMPILQVGNTINRLAPAVPPPTAKEVWRGKLSRYMEVKDSGIAAAASELAAMKADLEATYQAGFLAE